METDTRREQTAQVLGWMEASEECTNFWACWHGPGFLNDALEVPGTVEGFFRWILCVVVIFVTVTKHLRETTHAGRICSSVADPDIWRGMMAAAVPSQL